MGVKIPFEPKGTCATCKFSGPIPENHFRRRHYPLFCFRHPPTPATGFSDIWGSHSVVQIHGFCAMYESEE